MHALNTIKKINAEALAKAFAKTLENCRGQGRWVLGRYDGLTLTSIETFAELSAAQFALEQTPANVLQGERAVIYSPTAVRAVPERDQSEDRAQPYTLDALAGLGARSVGDTEQTLGGYINRKSV